MADNPVDSPASSGKKHRKDKPWDNDSIDHWKVDEFKPGEMENSLLEESSFATLFPKYREKYLRDVWPTVTTKLKEHGIACELNLFEGSMTVKTTRKTWDPYAIIKARDFIKLLSRGVPAQQASKIMQDEMNCDIIKIGNSLRNKDRFVKRRQRLIGPDGATLKALELLTECYILVQGNTVSVMGMYKGLKQVRRIVEDCMKNIHPIYHVKTLMIRRELAKDPKLAAENWDRFLPKFKKKNVQSRKPAADSKDKEKEKSPFPPAPTPRKQDLEMETGEYWLREADRKQKKLEEKKEKQKEKVKAKQVEREKDYIVPDEKKTAAAVAPKESVEDLAQKLKNKSPVAKVKKDRMELDNFVLSSKKHKH